MKKSNTAKNKDTTIDMPEVKDIPGQENIKPPRIREMEDTTISSDDEEGKGIVDDLNKEDDQSALLDESSDISVQERRILHESDIQANAEAQDLRRLKLDKVDDDPSAEQGDPYDMGEDLDVPGAELDDDNEDIGEEDEENNSYSLPD